MSKDEKSKPTGYGNPPKAHQFKKGQSGNPKGRPKGKTPAETLREHRAMICKVAMIEVPTVVDGEPSSVSAYEAVYIQLFKRAMEGHGPSIRYVDKLMKETISEHEEQRARLYEAAIDAALDVKYRPNDVDNEDRMRLAHAALDQADLSIDGSKPTDAVPQLEPPKPIKLGQALAKDDDEDDDSWLD